MFHFNDRKAGCVINLCFNARFVYYGESVETRIKAAKALLRILESEGE